jgi:hypothetical protein
MSEVILNGGLGNQLFQLALALHQSSETQAILNANLGLPRRNMDGQPDVSSLIAGIPVSIKPAHRPKVFVRKLSTLAIRQSAKSTKSLNVIRILEVIYTLIFSINERSFRRVRINCGVGLDARYQNKVESLNFGYFQTFQWASEPDVLLHLKKLKPRQISKELGDFVDLHTRDSVLGVHVRLTDYKLENSFGIPSKKYYEEAIKHIKNLGKFDKIWLFSDEPAEALSYIPPEFQSITCIVPEFPGGVSETFDLMRHCNSYVIGNSTFSWWGAFLSHTEHANVVAPSKWFRLSQAPLRLIPDSWHQIDPYFEND